MMTLTEDHEDLHMCHTLWATDPGLPDHLMVT